MIARGDNSTSLTRALVLFGESAAATVGRLRAPVVFAGGAAIPAALPVQNRRKAALQKHLTNIIQNCIMFSVKEAQTGLTIKTVAERTGVSVHTLRAWERRYGIPRPTRNAANRYRLYDERDLADVRWMKRQIESGLSPAQARLLFQPDAPASAFAAAQPPLADTRDALLAAFLASDEPAAQKILDQAFALFAPEHAALDILQPVMVALGERWATGEVTIWQEHLASNLVRRKLSAVLQAHTATTPRQPRVLTACAPAEEHEIGLLIFALLAQQQGWRVTYLGQRTPLADIANAARDVKPNWVVISVTTVIGLTSMLPWLVKENYPSTPLAIGGGLPTRVPALQAQLPGAFLAPDLGAAARALATLKPHREFFTPRRRHWDAAIALQEQRLTIAATVTQQMMNARRARWHAADLHLAGAYLTDLLACALAFDAPELMDAERQWLAQILPPRGVPAQAVADYLQLFARALDKILRAELAASCKPWLSRLENRSE